MPLSGVFQACECAAARMAALRDLGNTPSRCNRRKSFHGQPAAVETNSQRQSVQWVGRHCSGCLKTFSHRSSRRESAHFSCDSLEIGADSRPLLQVLRQSRQRGPTVWNMCRLLSGNGMRRNFESPESLAGTIQFGKGARSSRPQLSASGRKHSDARKNTFW
jgi:hypothetical protein